MIPEERNNSALQQRNMIIPSPQFNQNSSAKNTFTPDLERRHMLHDLKEEEDRPSTKDSVNPLDRYNFENV
jgi:hypothetical protein